MSDACTERSLAEKAETAKRNSLLLLASKLKSPYVGKILERGKAVIEHISPSYKSGKSKKEAYEKYKEIIDKAVKDGAMDADHAGTLLLNMYVTTRPEVIESVNKAYRQIYLDGLRKTDPELYKEILRRDAEHEVAQMGTMRLIKEIIKDFLKKS